MITLYIILALLFVTIGIVFTGQKAKKTEKFIKNSLIAKNFLEKYTPNVIKAYNMENTKLVSVMRRKSFAKSDIFSRCKFCNGLKISGICQLCGGLDPCSWCGGVIQPTGKSRKMGYEKVENMSHGICNFCCEIEMQKLEDDVGVDMFYPGSMSTFRGDNEIC